jgi:hypothetical protein
MIASAELVENEFEMGKGLHVLENLGGKRFARTGWASGIRYY